MAWIFRNKLGTEKRFTEKEMEDLRSYSEGDTPNVITIPTDITDKDYYLVKHEKD